MKRNLKNLAHEKYDVLIIGGGISGGCIAWDAALRGLKVALVEKNDFSSATSAATSKLVHGGLRYLKNLEFDLVRESLAERRIMEIIAPHMVYPLPFVVPIYKGGFDTSFMMKIGMFLYDILSYDKSKLADPEKRIPNHTWLSVKDVLDLEPNTKRQNLIAGALYYDCQMFFPERLVLAFLKSAAKKGAEIANYVKVARFIRKDAKIIGAVVKDEIGNNEFEIQANITINASGPWADLILKENLDKSCRRLVRSQGIHIITRAMVDNHALVLRTQAGRHFFIIPWRGLSLIGTTDTRYEGDPDDYAVTEKVVEDFIDEINWAHTSGELKREDVLFAYGGLRPLVEKETSVEVYKTSRKYEICDHKKQEGIDGLVTIIGGKYTTSRNLARKVVDHIFANRGRKAPACITNRVQLFGGEIYDYSEYLREQKLKKPFGLDEKTVERLVRHYGSKYGDVLKLSESDRDLAKKISPTKDELKCEVLYAVKEEMAQKLEDVVLRRTGMGTVGYPGKDALDVCADIMAKELGWSEDKREAEVGRVDKFLSKQGIVG